MKPTVNGRNIKTIIVANHICPIPKAYCIMVTNDIMNKTRVPVIRGSKIRFSGLALVNNPATTAATPAAIAMNNPMIPLPLPPLGGLNKVEKTPPAEVVTFAIWVLLAFNSRPTTSNNPSAPVGNPKIYIKTINPREMNT